MAKATEITVDVHVKIPDETICRCFRILEMWMDENPDKDIIVDREYSGEYYTHRIHVRKKGTET